MVVKLANSTTEKLEQLTARVFPDIKDDDSCYLKVYETFSEACVNPELVSKKKVLGWLPYSTGNEICFDFFFLCLKTRLFRISSRKIFH